jgi:hypothetical protein
MNFRRRQLLQALGLGALGTVGLPGLARADGAPSPQRVVFYVTPHGFVPKAWKLQIPGSSVNQFAERSLLTLRADELTPLLRPMHAFRDRMLVVEGLARISALQDIADIVKRGAGDLNNHSIGVAHALSGVPALQRDGSPCIGGGRSIDQEIGVRLRGAGRLDSRVYGFDYAPNGITIPFSMTASGQPSPKVSDPQIALADLLGYYRPPQGGGPVTREARIAQQKSRVLDAVAKDYAAAAPRLQARGDNASGARLLEHGALVRQLQSSLGAGPSARCDLSLDATGHAFTQLTRLTKLALACDLTRVVTLVAPVLRPSDLGYAAAADMHGFAHESVDGATSCGTTFNPTAERCFIDLHTWHATQFAGLLRELDGVAEGDGTLLDHTLVVWLSELATPTHEHHGSGVVLAGASKFFKMGRYVRYPATTQNPIATLPDVGPGHNRLLVSILQSLGQADTTFGMSGALTSAGQPISLRGPLTELHR